MESQTRGTIRLRPRRKVVLKIPTSKRTSLLRPEVFCLKESINFSVGATFRLNGTWFKIAKVNLIPTTLETPPPPPPLLIDDSLDLDLNEWLDGVGSDLPDLKDSDLEMLNSASAENSIVSLSFLESNTDYKFIRLNAKQMNAIPLAVAKLVFSGGKTLFAGNEEELAVWKSHLALWTGPRDETCEISFAATRAKSKSKLSENDGVLYDRVVASQHQDVFSTKRTYYCSLAFCSRTTRCMADAPFTTYVECTGAPALVPVSVRETILKFEHRICSSRREQNFVFDCPICGDTVSADVVETTCRHSMCLACFRKTKSRCPFCRESSILAQTLVNPGLPTVQELVDDLMSTRDRGDWIVLCRGSSKTSTNPILTRFETGPRRTASRDFRAAYRHDLSSIKGLIIEENWCTVQCWERVVAMMAGTRQRTIDCFRLQSVPLVVPCI